MADPENIEARLQKLREDRDAREAKRKAEADARELEALELEAKYEADLGPRGVKFDIVSNDRGNVVVKLGDFMSHKRFNSKGENVSEEDVFQLVLPAVVHPDRVTATALFREHAGIAWDCALAMQQLYRAKREANRGK